MQEINMTFLIAAVVLMVLAEIFTEGHVLGVLIILVPFILILGIILAGVLYL